MCGQLRIQHVKISTEAVGDSSNGRGFKKGQRCAQQSTKHFRMDPLASFDATEGENQGRDVDEHR